MAWGCPGAGMGYDILYLDSQRAKDPERDATLEQIYAITGQACVTCPNWRPNEASEILTIYNAIKNGLLSEYQDELTPGVLEGLAIIEQGGVKALKWLSEHRKPKSPEVVIE